MGTNKLWAERLRRQSSLERRELHGQIDVFNQTQELLLLHDRIRQCEAREKNALSYLKQLQRDERDIVAKCVASRRRHDQTVERNMALERSTTNKTACVRSAKWRAELAVSLQGKLFQKIQAKRDELNYWKREEARTMLNLQAASRQLDQDML